MLQPSKLILIGLCLLALVAGSTYVGFRIGTSMEIAAQVERDKKARDDQTKREERLSRVEDKAAELLGPQPEKDRAIEKEVIRYATIYRYRDVDCGKRDADRLRILNDAYGVGQPSKLPRSADGGAGAVPAGDTGHTR